MYEVDIMEFKDRLKSLRKSAGFKEAKDFAKKLNIAYSTYIQYEQGTEPKLTNLVKIADCLGISIDELIGRKPIEITENDYKRSVRAILNTSEKIVNDFKKLETDLSVFKVFFGLY